MRDAASILADVLRIKQIDPRILHEELNCSKQLITKMYETEEVDFNVICRWALANQVSIDGLFANKESELTILRKVAQLAAVNMPLLRSMEQEGVDVHQAPIQQLMRALQRAGFNREHPVLGHPVKSGQLTQCLYMQCYCGE